MEMVLSCRNPPEVIEGLRYCSRCGQAYCPDCLVTIRGNTYCATCKAEQVRDLTSGVDRNALELAGIGRRFGALFIDGLILSLPVTLIIVLGVVAVSRNTNFNPPWTEPGLLLVLALFVVSAA